MDKLIELRNLSKNYGKVKALEGINLDIHKGEVVGILGPNGSGKSTIIKSMAGLVKPSSGEVLINGNKINHKTKGDLAFLADRPFFYENFKVIDVIKTYNSFYADFDRDMIEKYMDHLYLEKNARVSGLSKGDMDKLAIALNLARSAKIYLFDEPLDGVDPISAGKILSLILDKIDGETTFVMSTHQIEVLENLFDRVIFLNQGQVHMDTTANDLREDNQMAIAEYYDHAYMG